MEDREEYIKRVEARLREMDYIGEGQVVVECPNCWDDVIVMWSKVGGDSLGNPEDGGTLSFKKGGGECENCGYEATPVLSVLFPEQEASDSW